MRWGSEIFHTLKGALKKAGHNTNVGDEGGFAPNLPSAEAALDFVMRAIEPAGFEPGEDIAIALDCAATEFFKNGTYVYEGEGKTRTIAEQVAYLAKLVRLLSDRFDRGRHVRGRLGRLEAAHQKLGGKVQLVGDDLFVTNVTRSAAGIKDGHRQFDPREGQPDRLADRDARPPSRWRIAPAIPRSCRTAPARPRIRPSPISRSPLIAGRSRPARSPARTALAKYNQLIRIEEELGTRRSTPARAR